MASALWVALLFELLIFANPGSSVAPGDAHNSLCGDLRAAGVAPIPAYSDNMRVLMDSWNYQNLLPTRIGAVWDQVDNDNNNYEGITTNWIQLSNTPCQQSVQVCGFSVGPQDNWLITQLINRTVNGMRLPEVSVLIEFEQQDCDITLNFQRTFNTHMYETSSVNATSARNTNNYRQVRRVSPDDTSGTRVNEMINIKFNTNHSSFYFAIQDETTCIAITRVMVFYSVCPSQTVNLIHFPEITAPAHSISPITVTTRCVDNAQIDDIDGSTSDRPRLICSTGGMWTVLGRGCRCVRGYRDINGTCISLRQLSCESLDTNRLNVSELECERMPDCSGLKCINTNIFRRYFHEIFNFSLLPCAKPSPAIRLEVKGQEDHANNRQRRTFLNVTVTQNYSTDLPIKNDDQTFGTYHFTTNFSETDSTHSVGIEVLLTNNNNVTRPIIKYTKIVFNTDSCSMPTTMEPPTNVLPTTLTPPREVEAYCSHVIWRNSPDVSCEEIYAYEVRLYNPDTGLEMIRRVDARGTFHTFLPSDKSYTEQNLTTVQIRVVSSNESGPFSSPVKVGCIAPEPSVHFELKGEMYNNNSVVDIRSIGEGDNALLCKTNKQDCCGTPPNRFGEFHYPNRIHVPIKNKGHGFYRDRGNQVIRLNRRYGTTSPVGRYSCEIPDADGVTQKIFINVSDRVQQPE